MSAVIVPMLLLCSCPPRQFRLSLPRDRYRPQQATLAPDAYGRAYMQKMHRQSPTPALMQSVESAFCFHPLAFVVF